MLPSYCLKPNWPQSELSSFASPKRLKRSCGNTESNLTNNRELLQGVSSALICYTRIEAFIAETAGSSVLSPLWSWHLRDSTMSLHYTSHRSVESRKKGLLTKCSEYCHYLGGESYCSRSCRLQGSREGIPGRASGGIVGLYGNPVCESQSQPCEGKAKFGGRA